MKETRKILNDPKINVSAFAVRVPVLNGHAEAVWVRFDSPISRERILSAWEKTPGLVVMDQPSSSVYPTQRIASGQDPVFVGRLHQDLNDPCMWIFWVVADNIRKGAALNGIQIAEQIFGH
jgi:aspartate-semialdehyde dehydrogenase